LAVASAISAAAWSDFALACCAFSRSRAIWFARSSSTEATCGSAKRDARMYSTMKMIAPQTTW
jgi:hypothetical protein